MEALKWWLTAERDQPILDRGSVLPPHIAIQHGVNDQIDTALKHGVFEDIEYLKLYAESAERIPLKKITLKQLDEDRDLIYLLRFSEIQELCLPIKNLTDLGLRVLAGLSALRKITFVAPTVRMGAAHMIGQTGLEDIHLIQTNITQEGVQHLKECIPQEVEVVYQRET